MHAVSGQLYNCLQCVSANICVVCNNYFLAQSGECVEHCPDGEYEVGSEELGRECMRCPSGFNRCISASYASECINHLYLTAAAKCESTYPDGFYRSPIHGKPIGRECLKIALKIATRVRRQIVPLASTRWAMELPKLSRQSDVHRMYGLQVLGPKQAVCGDLPYKYISPWRW